MHIHTHNYILPYLGQSLLGVIRYYVCVGTISLHCFYIQWKWKLLPDKGNVHLNYRNNVAFMPFCGSNSMKAARKHSFSKRQTKSATNLKSIRVNILPSYETKVGSQLRWPEDKDTVVMSSTYQKLGLYCFSILYCLLLFIHSFIYFFYLDQQHPWAEQSQFLFLWLNVKFLFLFCSFFDLLYTCWKRF